MRAGRGPLSTMAGVRPTPCRRSSESSLVAGWVKAWGPEPTPRPVTCVLRLRPGTITAAGLARGRYAPAHQPRIDGGHRMLSAAERSKKGEVMAHILLMQLDGSLPNLALARIARYHLERGDILHFKSPRRNEGVERDLFDVPYSKVYASAIFEKSRPLADRLRDIYPNAVIGGTGVDYEVTLGSAGIPEDTEPDFTPWPNFVNSIGFTQRGCRMKCSFCVVPPKEGGINSLGPIGDIWRGDPYPKNLILLDNDFFGSSEWAERIAEIRQGGFKVCFCQGINARFLNDETARALASVDYFDSDFRKRRLYTAWDNRRDEDRLFCGLESLKRAGVPPSRVMVYVLVGYDHQTKRGTGLITEDDVYRVMSLRTWGADPYPMPFLRTPLTVAFQRWCTRFAIKRGVTWEEYKAMGGRSDNASTPR